MQTSFRKWWHQTLAENWGFLLVLGSALIRVLVFQTPLKIKHSPLNLPPYFHQWQQRFLDSSSSSDPLGLHRGIFLGFTKGIPRPVFDAFKEGGLTHLVAASGFNCWIVGALFIFLSRSISPRGTPWTTFIDRFCQCLGAWLFWSWTEQSPPVTRAAVFLTIKALLVSLGIRVGFSRLLSIQYLLSICIAPDLARNASFQLTFGCLFGIAAATAACRPRINLLLSSLSLAWKPATKTILIYLATSMGACLGVAPTTWFVFGEVNFTSLLTNWLAVPPVTFIIMPLGLLQMMALAPNVALLNDVATFLGHLGGMFCGWYFEVLKFWIGMIPHLRYAPFRY